MGLTDSAFKRILLLASIYFYPLTNLTIMKLPQVIGIAIMSTLFGASLRSPFTGNEALMARQVRLRILTHNVYGVQEADCSRRARQFGKNVARATPKYDIVGVQEYYNVTDMDIWSCDAGHLTKAIQSTGRYKNSNNYYRFYPEVTWPSVDGGIGIFTVHPIKKFNHWRWSNDNQPWKEGKEGFIFARIEIPYTKITVDTYVVHLNSGSENRGRRKKQLQQLAREIEKQSSKSGNPVIVMGDFNIGGPPSRSGNAGYDDIIEVLRNPQDLWMLANPTDYGFTYDCINNNVAKRSDCKYKERIDFIFAMTDRKLTNSSYRIRIAKKEDVKVVRWTNAADHSSNPPNKNKYNVSDHFGLEATLEIWDR